MPQAEVTLPGSTSSVPTARRFVESILLSWGHPDLGWTAALVVSELAANAALHAKTSFTISVSTQEDGHVRLEVRDGSQRLPQQRAYGDDATTGRGLRLVSRIAADWGVDDDAAGKTVWVELDSGSVSAGGDDEEAMALGDLLADALGDTAAAAPDAAKGVRASARRRPDRGAQLWTIGRAA